MENINIPDDLLNRLIAKRAEINSSTTILLEQYEEGLKPFTAKWNKIDEKLDQAEKEGLEQVALLENGIMDDFANEEQRIENDAMALYQRREMVENAQMADNV